MFRAIRNCLLFGVLLIAIDSLAQSSHKIQGRQVVGNITVDGVLSETDWLTADSIGSFWQNFPYDTSYSNTTTTVKLLADKSCIYIAAICYDVLPGNYIITSLKRDFLYPKSDAFSVHIDPFNDQTNGFAFTVSPYGVQREGLIQNGGTQGVTTDWDNKWYAETHFFTGGYTVEMAIPFKSLRYNFGDSFWKINFSRNDLKRNENSTWKPVPRNMNIATLINTGMLHWQTTPPRQGFNAAIIPYAITTINQANSHSDVLNVKPNAGLDAKIVVTPSLNLDITSNPDFAQVEVDRQVINLSRFSIFFPERRNFFIENSDLFASFGFRQIRPFFSRKIGLANGENIPIIYGARISGKVNNQWRIGAMNVQTNDFTFRDGSSAQGKNYSVAAFQKQVFGSSNVAGIFVNEVELFNPCNFNRVAGMDYNLQSKNGKWLGKAFWHQSFGTVKSLNAFANATWLFFTDKKWNIMWNHEYVDKDYNAGIGFVPRTDYYDMASDTVFKKSYIRLEPEIGYKFFPHSSIINNINPNLYADVYRNSNWSKNDALINPSVEINFQNSAIATVQYVKFFTTLLYTSDVLGNRKDSFHRGDYQYGVVSMQYQSNKRKRFGYLLSGASGTFFNGIKHSARTELSYRIQPKIVLGLISSLDYITLPSADSINKRRERTLMLISPSFEWSFTRKIFFTTYTQYNSQLDNININARFQYRFRPMSDLYVVYSDNYSIAWKGKNRALTIKLIYWLNT
ncbi:MAG: DUF5916 domain-containing protein [Bacteroidota bacterium]